MLQNILIGLVAILHIWFFILERFIWNTPLGPKIFKISQAEAEAGSLLAANQGVYNLLLAIGLIWTLISKNSHQSTPIQYFILLFIIGVGAYGTATVGKNILFMQVIPAIIALVLVFLNSATPRINDISTSLDAPPKLNLEGDANDQIESETKQELAKYYSYITPLYLPMPPSQTFTLAENALSYFPQWNHINKDTTNNRITGSETTQFFRFTDDFAIEVREAGTGSEIHMRSRSRTGKSDFGVNAARIQNYFEKIRMLARTTKATM
ncbi:MAG: DUF1304 family protein [Bdellovibrionota bacterium]